MALLALIAVSLGWAVLTLRNTSPVTLQACMEAESGARAWSCRQALYLLHPTMDEVQRLNATAGAQLPVRIADSTEAEPLLQHYLQAGVDIDSVDLRSPLKWTALHSVVFEGNAQAVRLLLEHGARIDVKDSKGRTALDLARETLQKTPSPEAGQIVSMLEGRA